MEVLLVKFRGIEHRFTVEFETTTFSELGKLLEESTETYFPTQKLFGPGVNGAFALVEHETETLAQAGLVPKKRYLLMGSSYKALQAVLSAKPLRQVRTAEQEMEREAARSITGPTNLKPPDGEYTFQQYNVLESENMPPSAGALALLYRLANDPGIKGIMARHKWRVGLLSEMPPQGKVGISRSCVLGYNMNKGQEIALRLRTDDRRGFRKYLSIRETLVHELAHMVWSEHDKRFWSLNSQLLEECAEDNRRSQAGVVLDQATADFPLGDLPVSTDGRQLGGQKTDLDPGAAARAAAIRRQQHMIEERAKPESL